MHLFNSKAHFQLPSHVLDIWWLVCSLIGRLKVHVVIQVYSTPLPFARYTCTWFSVESIQDTIIAVVVTKCVDSFITWKGLQKLFNPAPGILHKHKIAYIWCEQCY